MLINRDAGWPVELAVAGALLGIADALMVIERDYAEPLTVASLAEVACMSERNFFRVFKLATGSTPIEALIGTRIHHAATRLRHTDTNIALIAGEVGFADICYFSRIFKQIMGMSPRAYRMG